MTNKNSANLTVGGRRTKVKTAAGDCRSKNVVYLVACKHCQKHYVGKTTQPTRCRMNQHRWNFGNYIRKKGTVKLNTAKDEDNYALGMHLYHDHGIKNEQSFDDAYELSILEVSQPRILDVREHMWIHRLKSLAPQGLNLASTYGLPLLS